MTAVAAIAAALFACAAPAWAQRDVPQDFYGVNYDADVASLAPWDLQNSEWSLQAQAGVETTRVVFSWAKLQPNEADVPDWSVTDPVAARAARGGIDLLPVVIEAPAWARENPNSFHSPPKDPRDMAKFMTLLIERYGENGTFWTLNPTIPKRPLRTWQIWNEPHLRFQWDTKRPWARTYGSLLRWSYKAIKKADPGATVVLAGMANKSWRYLAEAYKKGRIHGYFDVASLHPYTIKAKGVVTLAKRFRIVMKRYRDSRKPLWISELGLPASKGQGDSKSPLQTTDEGMADFLTTSMEKVIAAQRSHNVRVSRVYWYSWASIYSGDIFRFTGLRKYDPQAQTLSDKPAFSAFVESAQRHEACVKTSAGTCQ